MRKTYGDCITEGCDKQAKYKASKLCSNCDTKRRYWENPDKVRTRARVAQAEMRSSRGEEYQRYKKNYDLMKTYGITLLEYEAQLDKQNGMCALCGITECGSGRNFAVDHCHETGNVRGLLCANCNNGLGRFKDNTEVLRNAITYLNQGGVW